MDSPRNVLCCIYYYQQKEEILREIAWKKKSVDYERARSHFLKLLLQKILAAGASYRWDHPFHLQVKLNGWTFLLQDPRQLPALFAFLQGEPIKVPDWLSLLPCLLTEYPSEGIPPSLNRGEEDLNPLIGFPSLPLSFG